MSYAGHNERFDNEEWRKKMKHDWIIYLELIPNLELVFALPHFHGQKQAVILLASHTLL